MFLQSGKTAFGHVPCFVYRRECYFDCTLESSRDFPQAADGIIGLAPHQDSVLWQMADLMPPDVRSTDDDSIVGDSGRRRLSKRIKKGLGGVGV